MNSETSAAVPTPTSYSSDRLPYVWPVFIAAAIAALWIDLSDYHRMHHGDSLVPILGGVMKPTLFYWEGDRFGWLIPLLTSGIKDVFLNTLAQSFLCLFSGFAAFLLTARFLVRTPAWPMIGAVAAASYVLLVPSNIWFHFLSPAQCYFPSWTLGMAAALTWDGNLRIRYRRPLAFLLIGLAHWVNFGLIAFLGPLVVGYHLVRGDRRSAVGHAILCLFGAAVGLGLKLLSRYPDTPVSFQWDHDVLGAMVSLLQNMYAAHPRPFWAAGLLGIAGVVALAVHRSSRSGFADLLRSAGVVVGSACVSTFMIASLTYVVNGGFSGWRYIFPILITALTISWAVAMMPVLRTLMPNMRYSAWIAGLVLVAAAAKFAGPPSVETARTALMQGRHQWAPSADEIIDQRVTHLVGSYWMVWPTVTRMMITENERPDHRRVYGIAPRSHPTWRLYNSVPRAEWKLGVPTSTTDPDALDADSLEFLNTMFPKARLLTRAKTIWVFAPGEPWEQNAAAKAENADPARR